MNAWTAAAVMAGAVAMLSAGLCVAGLRRWRQVMGKRQRALEEQIALLDAAVRMIAARLAEMQPRGTAATGTNEAQTGESEQTGGETIDEAIAPEIRAAIAAAAVASLGAHARLRSARLVKAQEDVSAWSQQGRVLVQSSHNVRARR